MEKSLLACSIFQIERDALLAPIGRRENRIFRSAIEGLACVIAGTRPLDLDDLRAEIGEPLRRDRTGQKASQIENSDAVKRRHVRVLTSRRAVYTTTGVWSCLRTVISNATTPRSAFFFCISRMRCETWIVSPIKTGATKRSLSTP